jgi:Uncharacterised nucleotidyltransferase
VWTLCWVVPGVICILSIPHTNHTLGFHGQLLTDEELFGRSPRSDQEYLPECCYNSPMETPVESLIFRVLGPVSPGERRELCSNFADWESLFQRADEWRLLLPLWQKLSQSCLDLVPTDRASDVERQVMGKVLREIRRDQELAMVVSLIENQNIPVIAYKGPTLGHLGYGSPANRECIDLDLLVGPDTYEQVVDLLIDDGFEHVRSIVPRCYLRLTYEATLNHPTRRVAVDLHRSFFSPATEFWLNLDNMTPFSVPIAGHEIRTLNPEELLVVLAVHGSKHAWRELRWVYDLVALTTRQNIDWPTVYQLALRNSAHLELQIGLGLARDLFGLDSSELFRPGKTAQDLMAKSKSYLFGQDPTLRQKQSYHWALCQTLARKARYLWYTLVYPHELDLEWVDLPTSLWHLYYLVRPIRVVTRWVRGRLVEP